MIATGQSVLDIINSPVRQIRARAELYLGSALVKTFYDSDKLISLSVERVGDETKFFGFGICQRLNIKIIDLHRELELTTDNYFRIYFNNIRPLPDFYVTEVNRDEKTNELSVTAYCILYKAANHTVSELGPDFYIPPTSNDGVVVVDTISYTVEDFAEACAQLIGLDMRFVGLPEWDVSINTLYEGGANFDGTESIRDALTAIAEVTQTIFYTDGDRTLIFKRLDKDGEPVLTIDKSQYIELDSKTNRRLATITRATELGDNITVSTSIQGSTQFVRDNAFWDLREDINELLEAAVEAVGGLTINQFECDWRGNFLLEIGDKLALQTKDNDIVYSYLLDDTIEYTGAYAQKTQWSYDDNSNETSENPTSLGDAIKQTYAKVDKVNRQISLVASESSANAAAIAALQINTDSISASVTEIKANVDGSLESINGEIESIKNSVDAKVSAEEVTIQIQQELENGVDKITTKTGFTFDEEGLTVSKSDSEMSTQITEDGMAVFRNGEEVLTADNTGVYATNLHATTYLMIGTNSRFEDYDGNRTGCFWIGG